MGSVAQNEKSGYKPPEGFALLPRGHGPNAPYPPPYSENDPTSGGIYNMQPQAGAASSGPYSPPTQGTYPPPPQGSYSPPNQGSYPPPSHGSSYPAQPGFASQPGYGMPQVAYRPPQPSYPQPGAYGSGPGGYAPQGTPITNQPTAWMPPPQNIPDCPRGLEYLTLIDQLVVHQEVELLEIFTGYETENKYAVLNSVGQRLYYAVEESDCCARNCCGSRRPLDIKIMDNHGTTVINLNRPLACQSCCFPCCLQSMEVSSPPGTIVGTIEQQWSLCFPKLLIKNSSGDTILCIDGPCCTMSCCGDVEFKVMSRDGSRQVGKISKKWSGYAQEAFSDADNFGISFPTDLDVKMKAVVLGACFLIDMMYFERAPAQRKNP